MGTLTINGRKVTVDDSFASLPPEQQQATVEEIAAQMGQQQAKPAVNWQGRARANDVTLGGDLAPKPSAAQQQYDAALANVQQKYYPDKTTEQMASSRLFKPSDVTDLRDQGLSFGFKDELNSALGALGGMFNGQDFGQTFGDLQALEQARVDLGKEQSGALGTAAEIVGALPTAAAGTFGRATTLGGRVFEGVANGLVQGSIYGAGTGNEDRLGSALTGGGLGGTFGALAPVAGQMLRRVVTPAPASQTQRQAADVLRREGVGMTAGQTTGSKKLQYLESELGGGAADRFVERQGEQYTSAVLRRAGITAERATPQVIDDGFTRIGNEFDRLAAGNQMAPDQQFWQDLNGVWQDYAGVTGESARAPVVENTIRDLAAKTNGRTPLTGEAYKAMTSRLARLARSADPELKDTLLGLREAMDDAMERSIAQTNPGDLGAWREARSQYRNMLVIEKAATGAGADTAAGLISPAQLRNAAIQQGRRAFARGFNDFTELANAGVQALSKLPQSGTAPRLAARAVASIPAGIGAIIGSPAGLPGAAIGAAGGAAIPYLLGRLIMSAPGRAYLGNQAATGTGKMLPELLGLPAIGGGMLAAPGQ